MARAGPRIPPSRLKQVAIGVSVAVGLIVVIYAALFAWLIGGAMLPRDPNRVVDGSREVDRAHFAGHWPFTLDHVRIKCEWISKASSDPLTDISLIADGKTYGFGSELEPIRIEPGFAHEDDLHDITDAAYGLCTYRSDSSAPTTR